MEFMNTSNKILRISVVLVEFTHSYAIWETDCWKTRRYVYLNF